MKMYNTDITMLLDSSGSMSETRWATIDGVKKFIDAQQEVAKKTCFSLFKFSNEVALHQYVVPISSAVLDASFYIPDGGTALYDAIGESMDMVGKRLGALAPEDRPDKVIFVIVTDGEENASREFNSCRIAAIIVHQREKYNWEFVFLGANQDAIVNAGKVGINHMNSMQFMQNTKGIEAAFASVANNVAQYSAGATLNAAYSAQDRQIQNDLLGK